MIEGLGEITTLKEFNLQGCKIGPEAFEQFVDRFSGNQNITILHVEGNWSR